MNFTEPFYEGKLACSIITLAVPNIEMCISFEKIEKLPLNKARKVVCDNFVLNPTHRNNHAKKKKLADQQLYTSESRLFRRFKMRIHQPSRKICQQMCMLINTRAKIIDLVKLRVNFDK